MSENVPNPFQSTTEISYDLPRSSRVKLEVYDVLGRRVATVVDAYQSAGRRTAAWDGRGHPSGVYFYRLVTGEVVQTRPMVLAE